MLIAHEEEIFMIEIKKIFIFFKMEKLYNDIDK